ncbi:MAG: glycerol-3-phosphate 1-O-acyltransferase PlsY [Mycoplasmatales bacterium]
MIKLLVFLFVYLYGSIPFSLLVGFAYKKDIRKEGSGNVGGSNLGRTCGKRAFVIGFLLDFSKGALAVIVANYFNLNPIVAAVFALLGHTFPVFLKFKGGKGIATAFGFVCAYSFIGAMFAISIFLIVLKITKYVSLASIISVLGYVVFAFFFLELWYAFLCLPLWLFIVYMHRTNIKNIKNNTERKISWM